MKHKGILLKTVCAIAIVGAILSYNIILVLREKNEQLSMMQAKVDALSDYIMASNTPAAGAGSADSPGPYKDGVYSGSSQGYGGNVTMQVTIENGYISSIDTTDNKGEDAAYWVMSESVIPKIIENQSNNVDTVTGATFSSSGLINAVTQALTQAVN